MSVRAVNAGEVAELNRRGWVRLEGLIDRETASDLLKRAIELRSQAHWLACPPASPGTLLFPSDHDPLFGAFARDPGLGRAAATLLSYTGAVRLWGDAVGVVDPDTRLPNASSRWHQDAGKLPLDRLAVGLWIALDEIAPEQGSLRFREGSHQLGPLGSLETDDEIARWPRLARCPTSAAVRLAPGDATAHLSLTALAAGDNRTPRTLWPYSLKYFPDGARYTGLPAPRTDPLGLVPLAVIEHPAFPLI